MNPCPAASVRKKSVKTRTEHLYETIKDERSNTTKSARTFVGDRLEGSSDLTLASPSYG